MKAIPMNKVAREVLKVYHLELTNKAKPPPYDYNNSLVVTAKSASAARHQAKAVAAGEGGDVWLDSKKSVCSQVSLTAPGVVCINFLAG